MIIKKLDKSDNEQDELKDEGESSQQALLSDKGIINSQLALVNKILPPKWFTKVKIVVSHDYHFTVIAMIDSGADMNCIQEGLIPSKYFEKSTERLVSANGSQMKIKYELNNAHVCHDNDCFKIPSVLVKNITDKVILGLLFINALYPFLVEHDGITTDPFGQKVKFKFASKFEIDIDDALNLIHAFWHRSKHIVDWPYVKDFDEKNIPTKACPVVETVECEKEINDLLQNRHIINLSYIKNYPADVLIQEPRMSFCQYFTNAFEGNTHSAKLLTITKYPNILNDSLQESRKCSVDKYH